MVGLDNQRLLTDCQQTHANEPARRTCWNPDRIWRWSSASRTRRHRVDTCLLAL